MKEYIRNIVQKFSSDKDLSELLKGGVTSFLLKGVGLAMGFVLSMYISNTYDATVLGEYVLLVLVLRIFALIGKFGVDTALLRFIASYTAQGNDEAAKQVYQKGLLMVTLFSLCCGLLLYYLSPFISERFDLPVSVLRCLSLMVAPMSIFFVHQQCFRAVKNIAAFSFFAELAPATLTLIMLFVFSFLSVSIEQMLWPILSYSTAILLLTITIVLKWKPTFSWRHKENHITYSELLKVSLPLLLSQAMMLVVGWTDQIMLGDMATNADVGIYSAAFKLSLITSMVIIAINSIATPKFAEFYGKGDVLGLEKMTKQSTKMIFWTTVPVLLVLLSLGSFVLGLYGEEFKVAYWALVLLLAGRFIGAIVGSVGYIMQMTGKQVAFQNILLISAGTNILLNYLLIPEYGIYGAALASMTSIIFQNLTMMFYIKKTLGFYTIYLPIFSK